ncbi:hypothetical protein DYB25_011147 [Aphanomyces astaci]|uniref:DDE Tnp4 domain-containing protein n=1 Tax=Aphanomyces astaci TaxID=112090 RepID=A0A397ANQ6_APHAT|nr:hypothetical protein DYB25_011147 [Aphanomyces astaci]
MSTAIAACTMEVDDTEFAQQPQQKFIRPVHGYMDFLDVQEELPHGGDVLYLEQFRVSKDAVGLIVQLSKPHLPATLDARIVLLVILQWLASGVSVRSQEQLFQDHNHVTLTNYRQLGVRAITKGLVDGGFYGSDPHEPDRVRSRCEAFRQEHPTFNKCLGVLDGTHIPFVVSAEMQDRFRNRKGHTSTNVLGVVDELGRFVAVFAGGEGCSSDFICSQTEFERSVPSGYFYLGDAGYRLSKVLLRPYRNQRYHLREWAANTDGRPKTAKECFNYKRSKARIVVERAFGMLKIKWKVLSSNLRLQLEYSIDVIHVCAALHNLCIACNPSHMDDISDLVVRSNQDDDFDLHQDALQTMNHPQERWREAIANTMWEAYVEYLDELEF